MARKAPSRRVPAPDTSRRKRKDASLPEIRIAYTPAGRETMDAIQAELVPMPLSVTHERETSSPDITVRETAAGRETLAAIFEEAQAEGRPPQITLSYGDRVSNAPGAKTPSTAPRSPAPTAAGVEIFEMMTFVVRGVDASLLSSEALRRKFVEEHLLARLLTQTMDDVERVDVTPWTVQGTLVVRVWCRLPKSRP